MSAAWPRVKLVKLLHLRRRGLSAKEIAEALGVDVSGVYQRLRAAGLEAKKPARRALPFGVEEEDLIELDEERECPESDKLR